MIMNTTQLLEAFKDYVDKKPIFYATKDRDFTSQEKKEMREWKDARFIIDATKGIIYVFPGNLMHLYVATKLGYNYHEFWKNKNVLFFGEANIVNGVIVFDGSYDLNQIATHAAYGDDNIKERAKQQLRKLHKADFAFASKYIAKFDDALKLIRNKHNFYNKE
jgi:hypothetical protein